MIYLGRTFDLGWGMGIVRWYRKDKLVRGMFPISTVGCDMDMKIAKIIRIGEYDFGHLPTIQFRNVYVYIYIYIYIYLYRKVDRS